MHHPFLTRYSPISPQDQSFCPFFFLVFLEFICTMKLFQVTIFLSSSADNWKSGVLLKDACEHLFFICMCFLLCFVSICFFCFLVAFFECVAFLQFAHGNFFPSICKTFLFHEYFVDFQMPNHKRSFLKAAGFPLGIFSEGEEFLQSCRCEIPGAPSAVFWYVTAGRGPGGSPWPSDWIISGYLKWSFSFLPSFDGCPQEFL